MHLERGGPIQPGRDGLFQERGKQVGNERQEQEGGLRDISTPEQ